MTHAKIVDDRGKNSTKKEIGNFILLFFCAFRNRMDFCRFFKQVPQLWWKTREEVRAFEHFSKVEPEKMRLSRADSEEKKTTSIVIENFDLLLVSSSQSKMRVLCKWPNVKKDLSRFHFSSQQYFTAREKSLFVVSLILFWHTGVYDELLLPQKKKVL